MVHIGIGFIQPGFIVATVLEYKICDGNCPSFLSMSPMPQWDLRQLEWKFDLMCTKPFNDQTGHTL